MRYILIHVMYRIVIIAGLLCDARQKVMKVTLAACRMPLLPASLVGAIPRSRTKCGFRPGTQPFHPKLNEPSGTGRRRSCKKLRCRRASLPLFPTARLANFRADYEAYYEMGCYADLRIARRIQDAAQVFRNPLTAAASSIRRLCWPWARSSHIRENIPTLSRWSTRGLVLEPTSWSGHYYLAWVLNGLNRLQEAEKSAREAVRLKSDSPEAMRLLADIHSRQKDYRSLVNDLDEYLKLDPDSPIAVKARALRVTAQRLINESQSSSALVAPQN